MDDAGVAQPRIGGNPDDQPRLAFVIDAVHDKQKPSSAPPWYEPGGEWTFFDAHLADGTKLGFGFLEDASKKGSVTFAKGMLTVPDADHGAKLARAVADVFKGKLAPRARRGPLRVSPISIAVLGKSRARGDNGFSGPGTWTATKLFLHRPGIEAELFFNFDLAQRRGELAEKDEDYANDLVAFIARELRDGPPSPRTPETDPQISAVGPKLDAWRTVAAGDAQLLRFEDRGRRILFTIREGATTRVLSAPTDDVAAATEVTRTEHQFGRLACADAAPDTCVLAEKHPKKDGVWSSEDPSTFALVDRKKITKTPLAVPSTKASLASSGISPDGAFVTLAVWQPSAQGSGSDRVLHFMPVAGGTPKVVAEPGDTLDVEGWTGSGAGLRAVVRQGLRFDRERKPSWSLVDPRTGARTTLATPPAGVVTDETISPDGKRRVSCEAREAIVVRDVRGGNERRFVVHPDDRVGLDEECVSWASSRHLHFGAERPGFIDVETMKLSYRAEENA